MAATSGYQAGVEANNVLASYGQEVVWGTLPAVAFKAIRLTAESLTATKKRDRPSEFTTTGDVARAVTTQVSAGGNLSFALSFGTFDDMMTGVMCSDWVAAPASLVGSFGLSAPDGFGNQTLTAADPASNTLLHAITAVPWIRIAGFTNPTNNGVFRVLVANTAQGTTTIYNPDGVMENAAAGVGTLSGAKTLTNGTSFRSFFIQKMLSSTMFLQYPGSFVSDMTVTGGTGQFLNGTFTLLSQNETPAATNASTGAVTAAPKGSVNDPVGDFAGVYLNGSLLSSAVDSFTVEASRDGAALEFGMGAAGAVGVLAGQLEVKGTLKAYLKDFTIYNTFIAPEQAGILEVATADRQGQTYIFRIPQCILVNPQIVAGGVNQAVMMSVTLEGNPSSTGSLEILAI